MTRTTLGLRHSKIERQLTACKQVMFGSLIAAELDALLPAILSRTIEF
jgi:hypothetical protein